MDDSNESDLTPHKQLLMDAAAEIRKDQLEREKRRPQNVVEGTTRLVTESFRGAAMGTAAVVLGPIQGYNASGAKGIPGGLLDGIAVGLASTTVGVGSGVANFVQGTSKSVSKLNPPKYDPRIVVEQKYIHNQTSYHDRNNSDGTSDNPSNNDNNNSTTNGSNSSFSAADIKKAYLLERKRLYGELMTEQSAESAAASMDGLTAPVDNELYTELQVDTDATPSQIRKAYYRMAQLYHPDKHPDDPAATEKFQKISNAYQVLSDPVKREEYHRVGASAAHDEAMMDPKALFILMFADFEHIVGDLATATILMSGQGDEATEQETGTDTEAKIRNEARNKARERKRSQFQELREKQLVKLLERRLEPWMNGNEDEFIEHAKNEVMYLREQPFGRDCLKSSGYIYRKRAGKLLESKGPLTGVVNFFEDIGDKAHSMKSKIRALEGGFKALTAGERSEENETIDDAARREAVSTLGAVWLTSVIDIESTLRKVVSRFLNLDKADGVVDKTELKRKAQGLLILGKIFDQA